MEPARFAILCFIYTGSLLLALQAVIYQPGLTLAVIGNGATALIILFTGFYRLYSETGEKNPKEYGILAYGMAFWSLIVTLLFLFGLSTFWQ